MPQENFVKHLVDLDDSVTPGNRVVITPPTLRCKPYEFDGTVRYSAASAQVTIDYDRTDPVTGLPMAKITIPAGNTAFHTVDFYNMSDPWYMGADDVWFISNYTTLKSADLQVQLLYSDDASITGIDYRLYSFTGTALIQTGYNILSMLQNEEAIGGTEYGKVGTTANSAWQDNNGKNLGTLVRSIRLRVKLVNAAASPTEIFLGSVHTAPAGWAKSVVMWMADDVPASFVDLAGPIIESYGWKYCLAVATNYANAAAGSIYTTTSKVKEVHSKGHVIVNHMRQHENMDTSLLADKDRALRVSANFWKSVGIRSGYRLLAWPFGAFDTESIGVARQYGFINGFATNGLGPNPLAPGINPFAISRFGIEITNSWKVDSEINGAIKRGQGIITYGHTAVTGGTGVDIYPGAVSFYTEHLRRWCELIKRHEEAGNCYVDDIFTGFGRYGLDLYSDAFAE